MKSKIIKKDKIYLDYSATTPVDPGVLGVMTKVMKNVFGNPSSVHSFGREAKGVIEESRRMCLDFIGADEVGEIAFTSGGTEADNWIFEGDLTKAINGKKPHFITTGIEHKAILEKLKHIEKRGLAEATFLMVDKYGHISLDSLKKEIKDNTALISVMYANNEVGTVQPIREIGKYLEKLNKERTSKKLNRIYLHTDAVQAFPYLNCNVKYLHVDLMSVSGHKIYGPKGVGFLYIKRGTPIGRMTIGGGQEFGKRAGTENVWGIAGLARAVELLKEKQEKDKERIQKLRDQLVENILKIPGTELTGHPIERLPNLASFIFRGIEGESILISLDLEGMAVSTGSACTSGALAPSHVLTACGYSPEDSQGNIRISLGRFTKESDIKYLLKVLPAAVEKLRVISPMNLKNC